MKLALITLMAVFVTGCAHYEYDLVQPHALARHIGPNDASVPVDPMVYRLQTVDSYLVMRIMNPTDDPITLVGDRSVIVDPDGQSHRLISQTIAPHSYIKFILPPMPDVYEWDDDYWAGGYNGYGYRRGPRRYYRGYSGFYYEPRYVAVYDTNDPAYFDWSGETDVRITFKFDRAGKQFDQPFVFHRSLNRRKAE